MPARLKATLVHAGCSMAVALLLAWLVFFIWYPAPLDQATGVRRIFLLLLAVDVVIGPLLTFVVYKKGKKSLLFDLSAIVLLQVGALAYGLHAVYIARPAWLVFNVDRFDVVRANEIDRRRLDEALPQFRRASRAGPRWAAAISPDAPSAQLAVLMESLDSGWDIQHRPELYRDLPGSKDEMAARAQPIESLLDLNPSERVNTVLQNHPGASSWLPLMSNEQSMVILLDSRTNVLEIVNLRPW